MTENPAPAFKGWWTAPQTVSPHPEVARALRHLGEAPRWVPHDPSVDHDVVIVGGGQSGIAASFALRRAGISRTSVIDAASAGQAGVWPSKARMPTLRTPKAIPGPDAGIPALTFVAWYEEKYGTDAYAALGLIPTEVWAEYLGWLQRVTGVDVRYGTRLIRLEPEGDRFILHLEIAGVPRVERARKVVLATGAAGSGGLAIPAIISDVLPRHLYAHTDEEIDIASLRGRRVGILGAASSAFDAASSALEAGAEAAHVFCRHDDLAKASPMPALAYAGGVDNFFYLPDDARWNLTRILRARGPGPTPDTVRRAVAFKNFHLHLAAPWQSVELNGDRVEVVAGGERFLFDYVIAGTGYRADLLALEELRGFSGLIATWKDRYQPSEGEEDEALARYPYLGDSYQYVEREPGTAPYLKNLHAFNFGGMASYGRHVGDVGSLRAGIARLVAGISRDLFLEEHARQRLPTNIITDLTGEEYARAIWLSRIPAEVDT